MIDIEDNVLTQLRKGDNEAVAKLYKYYPAVSHFVKSNSGNDTDAEDIFQEALFVLIKNVRKEEFQLTSSIYTYLYSICRNLWLSQLKKRRKTTDIHDTETFDVPDVEALDFGEKIGAKEDHHVFQAVFERLGELCRKLLTYSYTYQWSMQQIAVELNYSGEQTARQQKYRCLLKARQMYKEITNE